MSEKNQGENNKQTHGAKGVRTRELLLGTVHNVKDRSK
jgi:hypothetical protein